MLAVVCRELSGLDGLSVEELPVWKPHPDAYRYATEALRSDPAALTMVAVHPWDLDGAGRAGLHTVWVDRSVARMWPSILTPPGRRVEALTALA